MLYRVDRSARSSILERFLLGAGVASFYINFTQAYYRRFGAHLLYERHGVPVPKTVPMLSADREQLRRSVDFLGGLPIVIKIVGGSHGIGVIQVDSYPALFSLADHLMRDQDLVLMRAYVPALSSARLIVLGNTVIDSIEYLVPEGDFRSNAGNLPQVQAKSFSPALRATAAAAVRAVGLEFGGVDMLITDTGLYYVTEVNFPCNFSRAQLLTGSDIAGTMVDYLMNKSDALSHA